VCNSEHSHVENRVLLILSISSPVAPQSPNKACRRDFLNTEMLVLLAHVSAEAWLPYGSSPDRWDAPAFRKASIYVHYKTGTLAAGERRAGTRMCAILNGARHVHLAVLTLARRSIAR